ncbi:RNA polymerase sigma factor [Parapedobacter koreensis]|uniref:RNA polymerase sigma-70 factor, ECF subfamily n=1 Tax=Parapedobacter koreensis TaxID=332977 RepID=A0A1H7T9T6_9SPHI|nr:RNA polymerase sigma-70 factor [Parapedobacter koreensis]SEL81650.1 RNA polymerase sigma-70 factor, ECF subfamily [Parapedobacter koreensis]
MSQYDLHSDFELADLLNQSDEHAFRHLYDKYWEKLYIIASNRLNDTVEGEEVVQDVFLNLWKKRQSFRLTRGFKNYFAVALKYEVINRRAKRVKNHEFQQLLDDSYDDHIATEDFHRFDLELLETQLEYRINQLPTKCRTVFTMSRQSALTNKQISETLQISEKAVEKHITHAIKFLKHHLSHYFTIIFTLVFG